MRHHPVTGQRGQGYEWATAASSRAAFGAGMRGRGAPCSALNVLPLGYRLQVRRVAADFVAAEMVDDETFGDRSARQFVCHAVRESHTAGAASGAELPVALVLPAS